VNAPSPPAASLAAAWRPAVSQAPAHSPVCDVV